MLKNIIISGVFIYCGLLIFAYLFANKMIFLPPRSGYRDSTEIIKIPVNSVATISAIYLPNPNAKYTILVSHGNAEDIGYLLPFLKAMQQHGFSVFAYDYQGYGTSTGIPTEQHSYQDVIAAYDYLTKTIGIPPERIIAFGHSVGAAVAIDLATKHKVAAVIAQGPFVSAFRVVTQIPVLILDKFNNLSKIKKINCPILIIHGTSDFIVPIWHGKKLYKEANEPKQALWVNGAGHNDLVYVAGDSYWQGIKRFVDTL